MSAALQYNSELGFKSAHPGGAFFYLGDGSARFISEDAATQVYLYLGERPTGGY